MSETEKTKRLSSIGFSVKDEKITNTNAPGANSTGITFDKSVEYREPKSNGPVRLSMKDKIATSFQEGVSRMRLAVAASGRVLFGSAESKVDTNDPFAPVFHVVEQMQEMAMPLITGVILAMILANAAPEWYKYNFGSAHHHGAHHAAYSHGNHSSNHSRFLAAKTSSNVDYNSENPTQQQCFEDCENLAVDRLLLLPFPIFGHPVTLHFFANDMIMCFHFGLAVKEVTEALLPGGSLNPPIKAANPIMATIGGCLGPVAIFFALLTIMKGAGMFADEYSFEVLSKGWGIVTATDIPLAWLVALIVYGQGHPAIDYLLLLAVADDALGMVIIAIFYTTETPQVQNLWLVALAMFIAWLLRKWHYRKERKTHQSWIPYVLICGTVSWVGLIKSKLHPALALVPIVPFMPGPERENLEHIDEEGENRLEELAVNAPEGTAAQVRSQNHSVTDADAVQSKVLQEHHDRAIGRGLTIQAGLYAGLVGHTVDDSLKVVEYDEDGNVHLQASTLDSFEHFWKVYVDFGLFLFAMCNAGVQITGAPGGMTWLVLLSLIIGKYTGIMVMFKISKKVFGWPAPLGIRTRHIRMIGLIASLGLTVALFVSDVAFTDEKLKDDARLGALISGFIGFACYAISTRYSFAAENVVHEAATQIQEEMEDASGEGAMGVFASLRGSKIDKLIEKAKRSDLEAGKSSTSMVPLANSAAA